MEDLLGFLFFLIVFILGPLLGQMKKGQQQGPQQRPPQVPRAPADFPRVPSPSRMEEVSHREPEPQRAAEMLPDELWEILTGQKRPAPTPVPAPTTRYDEAEPDEEADWVEVFPEEARGREEVRVEERSLETYEPHEVPVVVSMETLPPPARVRHEQFHKRIAQPAEAAPGPAPSAASRLTARARRGTLRDVIVLQEVLGRPKGLE